ncbi:unnamed protein product [Withania somnifera]
MVAAALNGRAKLKTLTFLLCRSCFNRLNYSVAVGLHSSVKGFRAFYTLHRCGNFFLDNCIKSIPVGVLLNWPTFAPSIFGCCESFSTQASPAEIVDEVLVEILSVTDNSQSSGEELCATYIDKFCNDRNVSGAIRLVRTLHDKNISLHPSAHNRLLKAALEENDIGLLFQCFKVLLVSCKSLNSSTYLIFAQAFVKENDVPYLLRFVQEISELILPSSTTVVNRIIFAFAECGQVYKALLIFYQMKSLTSKPDVITYNTILGILGKCGRVDEMLNEFVAMKEEGLIPDIISYNTLITGLRKVGRLGLCLVFFREMCEREIEPDLRTYRITETFNEMKHKGICPSIHVYRLLISNLKKMGKLELAISFSNEMKESIANHRGPNYNRQRNR